MKKGITLMAVLAVIIVLSILTGTVSVTAVNIINNINKTKLAMEFAMVEEAYNSYNFEDKENLPFDGDVLIDVSKLSKAEISQYFKSEIVKSKKITLKKINMDKLDITNMSKGYGKNGPTDIFAVSEVTNRIYYVKGIAIGNSVYYSYTDELKKLISASANEVTSLEHGLILNYDETIKNDAVEVVLKIPKKYTNVQVIVPNEVQLILPTASNNELKYDTNYYCYIINRKKTYKDQYTIIAKYTVDGTEYTSSKIMYAVNVEKTLQFSNEPTQVFRYDVDRKNLEAYITGFDISNKQGDIVTLKYDNFDVSTITSDYKKYFQSNGINVKSDRIPINKGVTTIFIYMEDSYGNQGTKKITIDKKIIDGYVAADGEEYSNPPVPQGFKTLDNMSSYTSWNGTFTIVDENDNQFVWVPVGANVTANGTIFGVTSVFGRRISKYTNGANKDTDLTKFLDPVSEIADTTMGAVSYEKMYDSVKKYQGFYISRYEISRNSSNGELYSKAGMTPLSNISITTAKNYARTFAEKYPTTSGLLDAVYATTILPTAAHYDTLCQYFIDSKTLTTKEVHMDSGLLGKYRFGVTTTGSALSTTYIADIAGNAPEWTLEKEGTSYVYRNGFGGKAKNCISARNASNKSEAGMRLVLYLTDVAKD